MNKNNIHRFRINYTSEQTGEVFEGSFICRRQSIVDKARIRRRTSELGGGYYCVTDEQGEPTGQGIDPQSEFFNKMIAILETVIETSPEWFDVHNIYDENLAWAILKEVMDYEVSFLRRGREADQDGQSGGSSQTSGTQEHQGSVSSNAPQKVVDGQVQAALDA